MGVLLRGSNVVRFVRFGKRTIKAGEAVAVWTRGGVHREVVGPCLLRLFYSTIRFLDRHVAGPSEYLVINHADGRIEHKRGPCAMYCNPVFHQSVAVKGGVVLSSPKDVLVVYQQGGRNTTTAPLVALPFDSGSSKEAASDEQPLQLKLMGGMPRATEGVSRRVIVGPSLFTPEVGEWIHKFAWTRVDGGAAKKKEKESFSVLNTGARRWDIAIPFRTADSVQITARLSLEFDIKKISALLDGCNDPVAALQSLLTADLGEFGTLIRSDDLLNSEARNKIAIQLGDIATYKKLTAGAVHMGIGVVGICLHGTDASQGLQRQYNHAIETKATLETNRAVAAQKQEMADSLLANQQRRMENEQAISAGKLAHQLKMEAKENEMAFAQSEQSNQLTLRFLKGLKECGVDLTEYLTSFAGQKATINHLRRAPAFSHLEASDPSDVRSRSSRGRAGRSTVS